MIERIIVRLSITDPLHQLHAWQCSMTEKCTVITIKASEVPREPVDGKPTVVYWDIVGIVHPVRMALAYSGVEWCDVRLVCGQPSDDGQPNKREWFKEKKRLQEEGILDFPNLPYFLDADEGGGDCVKLVQTDAILRYLGNKYDLMGVAVEATVTTIPPHVTDMLLEEARDLDDKMVRISYEEGGPAVAAWLASQELRDKLDVWRDKFIQKGGGTISFVLGTTLTVVDLKLYTFLYKFQVAQVSLMLLGLDTPALPFWVPAYMGRVKKATPELEAFLDCAEMKIPINNPHAKFDNF